MGKSTISVKVARTGSKVIEVELDKHRTVQDALDAAGINKKDSEEVLVNGEEADVDYDLENKDRIVLVKNVQGGNLWLGE